MKTTIEIGRKPYVDAELFLSKNQPYLLRCCYYDFSCSFVFSTNDAEFDFLSNDEKLEAIIEVLEDQIETWVAGVDEMLDAESAAEAKQIRDTESFIESNWGRY